MPFRRGRYIQPSTELVVPAQEILPPREIPAWARSSHEDILEDQLAGIESEMAALQDTIDLDEGRALYEGSLIEFFRAAWNEIDKLPFKLNWHHECLPADAVIMTEDGPRQIADIVADANRCRIASYNHASRRIEWQNILGVSCSPGKQLLRIVTSDGKILRCTEEHPVYVEGRGYTAAVTVALGDRVKILRDMQSQNLAQSSVLQPALPVDREMARAATKKMPALWGRFLFGAAKTAVLQPAVFWFGKNQPRKRSLPDVWGPQNMGARALPAMLSPQPAFAGEFAVHPLRKFGVSVSVQDPNTVRDILQRRMFHRTYAGTKQSRLHRWRNIGSAILSGVSGDTTRNYRPRRRGLFSLLCSRSARRASSRSRQSAQCAGKFDHALSAMPQPTEGFGSGGYGEGGATIVSVEPEIRIPEYVFNLEVAGNNNYFAGGVLVHNCIAEHLVAVADGEIKKLLINIPPRTGKTSLCTVVFPAWLWAQTEQSFLCGPQGSFLCVSYGETPAYKQAATARQLLMGRWYQRYWGDKVKIIKDGLDELRNDRGGYRISSSLAGAILGSGANLRIVDDPHNTQQAESTIDREKTVSLFSEGLTTRRTDPLLSAMIVVMQRLHSDDVSGHILENEPDYTQLILPMRYDPRRFVYSRWSNDPREEDGELLWPEQFPEEVVDADERTLAVYAFAGQYQQAPVPRGGGIIERNWFRLWPDDSPEMAERATVCSCAACGWMGPVPGDEAIVSCIRCQGQAERKVVYPPFSYRGLFVDTNYGEKEENSWSAAVGIGVWHGKDEAPRAMLMTAWRGRPKLRTPPKEPGTRQRSEDKGLVERIHEIATRHQVDEIVIEQKMRGFDLYNELETHVREWPYRLVYFNPTGRGDKVARLNATVPVYTNDLVWAPNKGWAETVINETTTAPRSKYWDLVDCLTMGLLYLRHDRNMLALPDEHRREAIRERVLQSQSARFNASEMIEGA